MTAKTNSISEFNSDADIYWMQKAIKLARKAQEKGEVPVGALVVVNNEKVGAGWNQPVASHDPSAHAEIIALRRAGINLQNYRLNNATLYVTLEPCVMCVGAMVQARIKRLVFGAKDPKAGALESKFDLMPHNARKSERKFNHYFEYSGGVLEQECGELLKVFFKARRKKYIKH